jgi:PAS domain S-box-containing protein
VNESMTINTDRVNYPLCIDELPITQVVNVINDAVMLVDVAKEHRSIVYVNPAYCDLSGLSESELLFRPPNFLQGKEADPGDAAQIEKLFESCKGGRLTITSYHISGVSFLNSLNLTPLYVRGQLRYYCCVMTDVTELENLRTEAANLYKEITHLSRLNVAAHVSTSLAHELIQPLSAIMSNAQAAQIVLNEDNPNLELLREIISDVISDDRRAGEVIYGLRNFLKKGDTTEDVIDINNLVCEIIPLLHSEFVSRKIDLSHTLQEGLPCVCGSRIQLQQVLINLILNAMDALDNIEGHRRKIEIESSLQEHIVVLNVIDFGVGIAPGTENRLFEKFYSTKSSGLGMGLAISQYIAEAHGGRIYAKRNPTVGSTFTLEVASQSRTE